MAVLDLEDAACEETVEQITEAGGRPSRSAPTSRTRPRSQAAVDRGRRTASARRTILVNNAGVLRDNLLFKMTDDDWTTVMERPPARRVPDAARSRQKHMVDAKYGRIVNLSSTSALGNRGQANYSTAKAGCRA